MALQVSISQFSGGIDAYTKRGVANYLQWMCGKYGLDAQYVIQGIGGGTVLPIFNVATPNPIEFNVSPTSFIPVGGTSATIQQFIGYNLIFIRGGVTQSTIDTGGSYFTWNKANGLFTCSPAAYPNELFQLYPVI